MFLTGRLASALASIAVLLPLAIVLPSLALSPTSNWIVRGTAAGFCILAVSRPDAAFLVTTGLIGFGIILSHLAGAPYFRVPEFLVVALIASTSIRALRPGTALHRALANRISVPVVLFALAAIASTIVWLRIDQLRTGYASTYLPALLRSVATNYFFERREFQLIVMTAAILEGLALYVIGAALCEVEPAFFQRAVRMLTLGGAGLGTMSAVRLAEILLRNPDAIAGLRATPAGLRISPQIPDYIAAGSYFALCWLAGLGLALASSRHRLFWFAAGLPLLAAIYLTGSRSVVAAALAGLLVVIAGVVRRRAAAGIKGVVALALLVITTMVLSYPWLTGRDVIGETARVSLQTRLELGRASLGIIGSRPLFGVGVGRYEVPAETLAASPVGDISFYRRNPHNDFLRIGAELGLVGVGCFLWLLLAAGTRVARALGSSRDLHLASLAGGLVAFLVTSMVSDPLMVREVSLVFWIALGLAAGRASTFRGARDSAEYPRADGTMRYGRLRLGAGMLVGALLVVSIPWRVKQELETVNLSGVSYGLYDWTSDADGTAYRWTGPEARFFVDGRARRVEITLRGIPQRGPRPQVEVHLDGRIANRIAVTPEWQRIAILPDDTRSRSRRIDLVVSHTWVPAKLIPGSADRRVLGVQVAAINVITGPAADH